MKKHSPAPWRFVADSFNGETYDYLKKDVPYDYHSGEYSDNPFIVDANGKTVVGCDEYYVFSKPENVRLMVHAPELLEALSEMVDLWENIGGDRDNPTVTKARQAIAKAEATP